MLGKGGQFRRFEQALGELQRAFLAAPTGIARDNRWKYTFRYAPLHVAFPKEVAAATELSSRAATAHLLRHYVDLVGPTPLSAPTRLFGWPSERAGAGRREAGRGRPGAPRGRRRRPLDPACLGPALALDARHHDAAHEVALRDEEQHDRTARSSAPRPAISRCSLRLGRLGRRCWK